MAQSQAFETSGHSHEIVRTEKLGAMEIKASHRIQQALLVHSEKPRPAVNPLQVLWMVTPDQYRIDLIDGDSFTSIGQLSSQFLLEGKPQFSSDGRYAFFSSKDGWISKYDLHQLSLVAFIRVGLQTQNLALSSDGRFVMVANALPHSLVALNASDLSLIRVIDMKIEEGKSSSVTAVYDAAPRKSFVATLRDIPEICELSYDETAAPVYAGLVHDYQLGEGIKVQGPFPPIRIKLSDSIDDIFFSSSYETLIGQTHEGIAHVVDLDLKRKIATLKLPAMSQLGTAAHWFDHGKEYLAIPSQKDALISVLDMSTWKIFHQVPTNEASAELRSRPRTASVWLTALPTQKNRQGNTKSMQIFDKQTLGMDTEFQFNAVQQVRHLDFSRDGRYALISLLGEPSTLLIYEIKTGQEVKRISIHPHTKIYQVGAEL
ncbi:cytochrome D1 domain-containing protein [Undibacterium sp.]|uniref:cytochrome D1 domain-containing protein n=1 Tax=Undibacterium sp. TaxID=1914977 RepID=UPI0037514A03